MNSNEQTGTMPQPLPVGLDVATVLANSTLFGMIRRGGVDRAVLEHPVKGAGVAGLAEIRAMIEVGLKPTGVAA